MDDYYTETLKQIAYSFTKILSAVKTKNLDAVKFIANQELKAINYDLELLKGEKN